MIARELALLACAFAFVAGLVWGYRWGWGARERRYREPVKKLHSGDVLAAYRRSRAMHERQAKVRRGARGSATAAEVPQPPDAA